MKAFVTGPTGFLGVHLLQELAGDGWQITAFHRPTSDLSELRQISGVEYTVGDVRDQGSLLRGMPEGVDAVFHTAGSVGFLQPEEEDEQYEINKEGTRNVVFAALAKGVGRFIYTSTVLTYDFSGGARVTEHSPPSTTSKYPYIHSKRLAELEVEKGIKNGLDAVFIHPGAVFGAYDKSTWSKTFREIDRGRVPVAPPGAASFCHMRQVAEAHVTAFHRGRTGEHYVLGGVDASFFEITREVAKILDKRGPLFVMPAPLFRLFARMEYWISNLLGREAVFTPDLADILCETVLCDSSKAVNELGYAPSSLNTMLNDCYRWMVSAKMLPAGRG
jgi:dihydroflavonol-4-reductase